MGCFSPIVFRFFVKGKNRSTTQFERCCVGYPPDPWALKEKNPEGNMVSSAFSIESYNMSQSIDARYKGLSENGVHLEVQR